MLTNFPSCPCTVSWLGRVAPLAGTLLCRFPNDGTPGHYTASEPTSSLNTGDCPPWRLPLNAHVAGCRPGPLSEGHPCPRTAHAAYGAPGPAHSGSPLPTTYPGPPWALGLARPNSPVPGVPTQRYSPFVTTLPTRQQGSCAPPKRDRAYFPTNSKTTSILLI